MPEYQPPPTSRNESELRKDGRRSHVTLQPSEFWQGRWFYKKTLKSYQIKARSLAWRFRLSAVWVSSPLSPAIARATLLPVHPPAFPLRGLCAHHLLCFKSPFFQFSPGHLPVPHRCTFEYHVFHDACLYPVGNGPCLSPGACLASQGPLWHLPPRYLCPMRNCHSC